MEGMEQTDEWTDGVRRLLVQLPEDWVTAELLYDIRYNTTDEFNVD